MRWNLRTGGAGRRAEAEQVASTGNDRIKDFAAELSASSCLRKHNPQILALVARLLTSRGVENLEDAEKYLSPCIDHLHSPYLMSGMKAAVARIEAAIDRKETILIYGDYDVDGTTAIVILKTAIELCGGTTDFHVPHRIREGYDLRGDVIENAAAAGIRLIVSVDSGIRAFSAAETARRVGVDLIVSDHHIPGKDGVPHATAVLNPNQPGCEYPCKALCGAGVAFKLAQALMERRLDRKDQRRLLTSFMKMVAIATIADSVPLTGENRVFARLGLEALRSAVNPGLRALLQVARLSGRPWASEEVAFRIAPRINAAGRMDIARDVVELFSVKDTNRAREIAGKLDRLNSERQEEERRIMQAIFSRIEAEPDLGNAFCMVIDGEDWHRGVIGISATRVVERYGRPALVVSRHDGEAHGSGRSIPAFHLLNALESCAQLFTRYGGHAHAVGFSMPAANLPELRAHMDRYARDRLIADDFEAVLTFDAELPLEQVTPELLEILRGMEPFGAGNPEPVFCARQVRLMAPPQTMKDKHVRLRISPALDDSADQPAPPCCNPDTAALPEGKNGSWRKAVTYNALGWRLAERFQKAKLLAGDVFDIAFTLDYNNHPDFGGLELSLKDFMATQAEVKST